MFLFTSLFRNFIRTKGNKRYSRFWNYFTRRWSCNSM